MKKLILSLFVIFGLSANAQMYKTKKEGSSIHFLSKSPLEDIEATNKGPIAAYKPETSDIQFGVIMTQFKFKAALMEEHFNENYVESEKYPQAVFKGKVNEKVDLTKDGENKVSVTGKMTLHGVTKDVTTEGTITKKGDDIILHSAFKIKVADYNIKVPSLYVQNIAEVVDVTVHAVMEPFVKK
jgi:polyisoprenoid-binding protein YceI